MNYGFSKDELSSDLDDLVRRHILGEEALEKVLAPLQELGLISEDFQPSVKPAQVNIQSGERVYELEGATEPWVPDRIDYLHDYR